jgi:hypothetical protein
MPRKEKMQTVADSKLTALGKEFPWFLVWFMEQQKKRGIDMVKDVLVQRADLELVQKAPHSRELVAIFDQSGVLIGVVGENQRKRRNWFIRMLSIIIDWDFSRYDRDYQETIEQAILRLESQQPYYVVAYHGLWFREMNQVASKAVIFKPKGNSLPEWLKNLRDGQAGELKKKLSAIG